MDPYRLKARLKKLSLFSDIIIQGLYAGNYKSLFRGQGMDFQEVRDYVPGDDIRHIDWNVTSRFGTPHTKVFREEKELNLFLLVDSSLSMQSGTGIYTKSEMAEILFSIFSLAALENGDKVGALFFGESVHHSISPRKGKTHILALIKNFSQHGHGKKGSDISLALKTARELLKRRSMCILISDFRSHGFLSDLFLLKAHHDLMLVRVTDKTDYELPFSGLVKLQDPETGEKLLAHGASQYFKNSYTKEWENSSALLTEESRKNRIPLFEISTESDPVEEIKRFFSIRKGKRL
ncbi:DUF58 domain-containing protein [Spirochaetia bacterium 38H-sp]|uniref:DUF58 domain-containing protein n=1 Tax=Rarispira pelagica TaxID=3141764 RepID=A0ABU9UCH7_9SPIR